MSGCTGGGLMGDWGKQGGGGGGGSLAARGPYGLKDGRGGDCGVCSEGE